VMTSQSAAKIVKKVEKVLENVTEVALNRRYRLTRSWKVSCRIKTAARG
jgi:hypothetical protein